jgi:N-acetylglucosamine-6-phosphate deacetylase
MEQERITAIVGGTVYTPDEVIVSGTVLIRDDTIVAVGPAGTVDVPTGSELVEAGAKAVVPGLIDLHIHGLMGYSGMGSGVAHVISALPAFGVTAFVTTTLTLPRDEILTSLAATSEVLDVPPLGAQCVGIHLEGPFLSPSRPGMATAEWFEPLSWEEFRAFQRAAGGHICMLTFAPEVGEAMAHIPCLVEAGVIPVIGHSDASFEQVARAVAQGLSHATHTFNAMRPLHHREPGVVGAVMYFDEIVAELIADGVHVHPAVMAVLLRVKGLERVALVSDAAPLAGLPDGEYEWGHQTVLVRDGSCRLVDGTIAGAHALLDTGVRNLVHLVGLPLEQALVPATRVPADVLGLRKGRLAPGYDADVVLLDDELQPALTLVKGEVAFSASSFPTSLPVSPE